MGFSASTGPLITYGSGTAPSDYNGAQAPNVWFQHCALLDPRALYTYQPGQGDLSPVAGWFSGGNFCCVDQVPSTAANNNIVAAGTGSGAGTQTLVSSSGAGITVGQSVVNLNTGVTVTGLLAIDTAAARITYGQSGPVQLWDPRTLAARNIVIQSASANSGVTFTIAGYDIYGAPMSENITGPGANSTVSGKKAFKYIASVTRSASITGNINVGTGDVFGFPLRVDSWGYALIKWDTGIVTANTGWLTADTNTATATTGDVRGTYNVQSASDNAKRLIMFINVSPVNVSSTTGLLGVTQF